MRGITSYTRVSPTERWSCVTEAATFSSKDTRFFGGCGNFLSSPYALRGVGCQLAGGDRIARCRRSMTRGLVSRSRGMIDRGGGGLLRAGERRMSHSARRPCRDDLAFAKMISTLARLALIRRGYHRTGDFAPGSLIDDDKAGSAVRLVVLMEIVK